MSEQNNTWNVRIQHKKDSAENWQSKNPVLLLNELIIVEMEDGDYRFKIGDGIHTYSDLLFLDSSLRDDITAAQEAARQAASSASAAAGSATAAAGSASSASTAAGQAQTAATNAGTSETNAASSASDAKDAKTAAETAASNASGDAAAAESAKTAAQTAATNAEAAAKALEEFGDPVTIKHGGTGASTAIDALSSLGGYPGSSAEVVSLWSGHLADGTAKITDAYLYGSLIFVGRAGQGEILTTLTLGGSFTGQYQLTSSVSYLLLTLTKSGDDIDVQVDASAHSGDLRFVFGVFKRQI